MQVVLRQMRVSRLVSPQAKRIICVSWGTVWSQFVYVTKRCGCCCGCKEAMDCAKEDLSSGATEIFRLCLFISTPIQIGSLNWSGNTSWGWQTTRHFSKSITKRKIRKDI